MNYTIKDLEQITGIKAHTIRMWEKRYSLLCPNRNCNNVRLYNESDLSRLVKVTDLYKKGEKISHLAALSEPKLEEEFMASQRRETTCEALIDGLTLVVQRFDEQALIQMLTERFNQKGVDIFLEKLIKPLNERVGILLISGHMQRNHLEFLSQIIEDIINREIGRLLCDKNKCYGSALVLCVGKRNPKLQALVLKYSLLKAGFEVTFSSLLPNAGSSIQALTTAKKYHQVFIYANHPQNEDFQYFSFVNRYFESKDIFVLCGPGKDTVLGLDESKTKRMEEEELSIYIQSLQHLPDFYSTQKADSN